MEHDVQAWEQYQTNFPETARAVPSGFPSAEQESHAGAEALEWEQYAPFSHADSAEQLVDERQGIAGRWPSLEVDPYIAIRPALRAEHASLPSKELTGIVGGRPALVALHGMLSSSEPQRVALAALLGRAGRRSARLNGSDVAIPAYLRVLSHLRHEAAEQLEGDRELEETRWVSPIGESAEQYFSADSEVTESPLATETLAPAEYPFAAETFEFPVAFEGQVPAAVVTPGARDINLDAFFEDEWAASPTVLANPRHVHFNRFTTLTATAAMPQTELAFKTNPLDPA
jgi:hypothetical protein